MIGGRSKTRTCDPLIKSQLLYQLSYAPFRQGLTTPGKADLIGPWLGGDKPRTAGS